MLQLTQKETALLQDQQKHEEICVQKYQSYANQTQDPQLRQLFSDIAQVEQQHLDSVTQMLSGQIPATQQGQQQGQQQVAQGQTNSFQLQGASQGQQSYDENDAALCNDMLMTEKYVSSTYNTAIFEFQDTNARQVLNHIQKEEQEHGEQIFNYMQSKGMYKPQ